MSAGRFEKLMSPGQIGRIKTKNRIIKTANGTSYIEHETGYVGDRALAYYEALAKGGVGMIIVESCGVEFPLACQHVEAQFRLDNDDKIPSYTKLAEVVHKHGCPIMVQFQHAGPWNPTGLLPKRDTKAASALTQEELPGPDFAVPRAMTHDEIKEMIDIWVEAGVRAWKAGFDGVEINGGTCHQINTFLSRIWNKREDEYGPQSFENRARFMAEVIRETKRRTSPDFTVTCLINIREYNHPKATTMEEGVALALEMEKAGADAIQCRAHIYGHREGLLQPDRLFYPEPNQLVFDMLKDLDWSRKGHGATSTLTMAVKKGGVKVPVWAAGRLNWDLGERFLREGRMDFIPMVRRLLADHDLPNKVFSGHVEDVRPCQGCVYCMDVRNKNRPLECRVNPHCGREAVLANQPAARKKKVMVIGGGPGGMQAALSSALRGHDVTLYDKHSKLGGLLPIAALVKDLEVDVILDCIRWYKLQMQKAGVNLKLKTMVTPELVKQEKPDAVIVATGGIVKIPEIPGINKRNVMILTKLDALLYMVGPKLAAWGSKYVPFSMPIGKKVVIMGGEHHACELGEFLTKRGRKVTIVNPGEVWAEGMTVDDREFLMPWFKRKGVVLYAGAKFVRVTDDGLVITTKEGETKTIVADTVLPSTLLKQNLDMVEKLKDIVPEIYTVGSCFKPEPDIMVDAIYAGAKAGHEV
ncbi:MAG: FAD-dependent oxidoreductase [Dehalococcoidales bacterium]|nr:FAD-dependent oxidoreductase [Dehalococcoidales bacterium]